jgi:sphinganine C4-monooxygenase
MNSTTTIPLDPSRLTLREPLLPFVSDKSLSLALPIVVYWLYSGFFHVLDMQTWSWLDKFRIHPPEEIAKRNRVTRWDVVKAVFIQQLGQVVVGLIFLSYEPEELVPDHDLAISKLRLPPWNLPNLASAEVMYWFLLPLLRQIVAVFVLDAWEYWIHRLMHVNKFLYRHLHSLHHRLYVPYAFGALYNHPLEGLILDTVGTAVAVTVARTSIRESMFFFCFATMKTGMLLFAGLTQSMTTVAGTFPGIHSSSSSVITQSTTMFTTRHTESKRISHSPSLPSGINSPGHTWRHLIVRHLKKKSSWYKN